jgi:hypothetical protein
MQRRDLSEILMDCWARQGEFALATEIRQASVRLANIGELCASRSLEQKTKRIFFPRAASTQPARHSQHCPPARYGGGSPANNLVYTLMSDVRCNLCHCLLKAQPFTEGDADLCWACHGGQCLLQQ